MDLKSGVELMPMQSTNLAYSLAHYILEDRFTQSERMYILASIVRLHRFDLGVCVRENISCQT